VGKESPRRLPHPEARNGLTVRAAESRRPSGFPPPPALLLALDAATGALVSARQRFR
jgi:hypothetical protein